MAKKIVYSKRDIRDINIAIGANLKAARDNAGMTMTDAMIAIWGVSNNRNRMSEIENGKKNLTLLDLLAFQKLYGQSLDYICGLSIEPEIDMIAGTTNNVVGQCHNMIETMVGSMADAMLSHIKSISKNDHEALLDEVIKLCDVIKSEDKRDRASPDILHAANKLLSVVFDIQAKQARQAVAMDMQMAQIADRANRTDSRHKSIRDIKKGYQYSIPLPCPNFIRDRVEDVYVVGGDQDG